MKSLSKTQIAGWVLSLLIALFLIGASAYPKLYPPEQVVEMFEKLGFTSELMFKIGILEVAIALIFLFPYTGFVGTILLTGYLGGAVVTHLRIADPPYFPIGLGVIAWIAFGLRRPEVFRLACGCGAKCTPPAESS